MDILSSFLSLAIIGLMVWIIGLQEKVRKYKDRAQSLEKQRAQSYRLALLMIGDNSLKAKKDVLDSLESRELLRKERRGDL
jgi:hypothetical protein